MTPLPLAEMDRVGAYGRTPLPLTGLPKYLASQRFTLEKLEAVVDQSLGATKDVVWALSPAGAPCPACGARHGETATVILSPDSIGTKPALSAVEGNLGRG